jgi:hypothetical protein
VSVASNTMYGLLFIAVFRPLPHGDVLVAAPELQLTPGVGQGNLPLMVTEKSKNLLDREWRCP